MLLKYSLFTFHALYQVAIIAGNFDLAEIIKVHKASDVGKLAPAVTKSNPLKYYSFERDVELEKLLAGPEWWKKKLGKVIIVWMQG